MRMALQTHALKISGHVDVRKSTFVNHAHTQGARPPIDLSRNQIFKAQIFAG